VPGRTKSHGGLAFDTSDRHCRVADEDDRLLALVLEWQQRVPDSLGRVVLPAPEDRH